MDNRITDNTSLKVIRLKKIDGELYSHLPTDTEGKVTVKLDTRLGMKDNLADKDNDFWVEVDILFRATAKIEETEKDMFQIHTMTAGRFGVNGDYTYNTDELMTHIQQFVIQVYPQAYIHASTQAQLMGVNINDVPLDLPVKMNLNKK